MIRGKRGSVVNNVVVGILVVFVLSVFIVAFVNLDSTGAFDLTSALDSVTIFINKAISPLFGSILGFDGDDFDFLKLLSFILLTIVLVSTLELAKIFGDDDKTKWVNFFVGLILSIIGVRYMPSDIWVSFTAPSSALVATVLIGLPFLALFFLMKKIPASARKFVWVFYVLFLLYLMITSGYPRGINVVYGLFVILSVVMVAMDARLRAWMKMEFRGQKTINEVAGSHALSQKAEWARDLKQARKDLNTEGMTSEEKKAIEKKIKKLENQIKNISQLTTP